MRIQGFVNLETIDLRTACGAALLAAILAVGCSSDPSPTTPADENEQGTAAVAAAAEQPAGTGPALPATAAETGPQPPDGRWLSDAEGRQYFIDKTPKREGSYLRLDDRRVRTVWGIPIEVEREDDAFFYYRVYKVDPLPPPVVPAGPDPEEVEAVAASYRAEAGEEDALRFEPFGQGLPTSGQWRNGFDLADMNGDGHLDIVHGPARKAFAVPAIFLGDGKGSWRRWRETRFPQIAYDYGDAEAADFNGDGHMDIALGMHLRGLAVLVGDGQGAFTNWSEGLDFEVAGRGGDGAGFSSRAIAVADWNADGRPDLLALGEGPRLNLTGGRSPAAQESLGVVIYLNQGDGRWVRKDQGTGSANLFGDSLTLGDFSGDGRVDFATGTSAMGRRDLIGVSRSDGGWDPVELDLVRPRAFVRAVEAADFDRDGRSDLAITYSSHELGSWRTGVDVLYSVPGGGWKRRVVASEEGRVGLFALDSGDLDGDGHLDLVALSGEGATRVFRGDGKGFFRRERTTVPDYPARCRGYHVQLADLDGDGDDELVSAFAGESSALFDPTLCKSGGGLVAWNVVPDAGAP